MEKTVLYSKNVSTINLSIKQFQHCSHDHCKKLIKHIRYLSNIITEKVLRQQSAYISSKSLKSKQNIPTQKSIVDQIKLTLQQEIQQIKKNYQRLKKQLTQLQDENDQLFEQNQRLTNKIEKSETIMGNKENVLTLTKENDNLQSKISFSLPKESVDLNTIEHLKLAESATKTADLTSTDRCELVLKNTQLLKAQKSLQKSVLNSQSQLINLTQTILNLRQENNQLKKIISVRSMIQTNRHSAIKELQNVMDQLQLF